MLIGIKFSFVYSNGDSKFTVLFTAILATTLVLFTANLVLLTASCFVSSSLVLFTPMLIANLQFCLQQV